MSTGAFGDDKASTLIHSVNCTGDESKLLDCTYDVTADPETCTDHSASVICQGTMHI